MMGGKDIYSNFGYYDAVHMQTAGTAAINGTTIDLQQFNACTFVIKLGSIATGGIPAASYHNIMIQHGLASAAGVSAWSDVVYGSQLLHSIVSTSHTLTSGVWQSITSYTDGSQVYILGYKKDSEHRYVRIKLSATGAPSVISQVAAIAVCGFPANWPINAPLD